MRKGLTCPTRIPTQIVSNEEFPPILQTRRQNHVEQVAASLMERAVTRSGVTRREFLNSMGGMTAALLAMNTVFSRPQRAA